MKEIKQNQQLETMIRMLDLERDIHENLKSTKRTLTVSVPVRLDMRTAAPMIGAERVADTLHSFGIWPRTRKTKIN